MKRLIRVDMKSLKIKEEEIKGTYVGLGGRALTSAIVCKEVEPTCHPLSAFNKLVIAPGLLSGSPAPCSGRLSVGCKSPLTGTIKEANSGGTASQALARLDIAAIVVEGKPQENRLYLLKINKDSCSLEPCDELRGLGNYDTVAKLSEKYGSKVSYISIGQAGEMRLSASSVAVTDMENRPTRHAARGGPGAVMGSKGLKAIVVDDTGAQRVPIKSSEAFTEAARKFAKILQEDAVTGEGLPTYGTNVLTNIINEFGGFPTRNFSTGQFEGTPKISSEFHRELILKRGGSAKHACHRGCIIQCSRTYMDEKGQYLTKGPEYETIWANGPNCGIDDLDIIAHLDRLYDDYGLDTIEMGVTLGVVMDSGYIKFGDGKGAIELIKEVGKGSPLGRILGCGAAVAGQAFGVARVPVVKRQALSAYDPRPIKGIGVTYATSTMGADHTAGYAVAANIMKIGGDVNPLSPEGQVELSRNLQIATAAVDSTGLCLFVAFPVLQNPEAFAAIYQMLNAEYGLNLTGEDVSKLGMTVLKMERDFNRRAGFAPGDDRLPHFFKVEPLAPHMAVFDVPDAELDTLFNF